MAPSRRPVIRDRTLQLPEPTDPPRPLEGPGGLLARASAARDRPFALVTPRVRVTGREVRGVEAVWADGHPLLIALATEAGGCASVVLAPSQVRRELAGPAGSILETVLAGDRVPGVAVQWKATEPSATPELVVRLTVAVRGSVGAWADDDVEAWRAEGPLLAVRRSLAPRAPAEVLLQITPAPTWSVEAREEALDVEARLTLPPGGHATLLVAAGPDPAGAAGTLRALSALRALEVRAEGAASGPDDGAMALDTGIPDLDDALPWAAARVRGALGPGRPRFDREAPALPFPLDPGGRAAWCGLGALAAGDTRAAAAGVGDVFRHPLPALLLGWLVGWTGDPAPLEARREAVLRAVRRLDPATLSAAARVAWRAALDGWIEAAETLGDPPWNDAIRERRDALEAPASPPADGVRLPVVGQPRAAAPADPDAGLVAALFGGAEASGWRLPDVEPPWAAERAVWAWAALATGRHDDGFRLLRHHLADGFGRGTGAWPSGDGHPRWDDETAAALVPAALLFGLLGARADAFYGRLRLAPRLPAHWARLGVGGIRVADARVGLRYARGERGHTFGIRQEGGRVPLNLVFEPEVEVAGPVRVLVDGAPAEVGTEQVGGRTRVRLQLPLDRDREVRVEPHDAGAGPGTDTA